MKKLKALLAIGVAVVAFSMLHHKSESHLRNRAVKLNSPHGSCSGEQVKGPSGQNYILTAGHCRVLEDSDGNINVIKEDGTELKRRVIVEDAKSDLLLLEGLPGLEGLDIAEYNYNEQHVRTFTHGRGLKTYKSEGEMIETKRVQILVGPIESKEDEAKCTGEKYARMSYLIWEVCILSVDETFTTAFITPGSSGGMAVDDDGALIGVVSAGGDGFGLLVPLFAIHNFMAGY